MTNRDGIGKTLQWIGGVAWIVGTIATGGLLLVPTAVIAVVLWIQRPKCPFCLHRIKKGAPVCRTCQRPLS